MAVPYSFDSTPWAHIPAVATDRFAFWITNPSMAMYYAFNDWCSNTDTNPRLAFEAESSYQSIQIWRIDPYEFCPTQPNGIRRCPEDQSATFRTLPGFVSGDHSSQVCFQRFYVVAPTMTYVNEYNIAITVLETSFRNIDTATLRPRNASDARCGRGEGEREGPSLRRVMRVLWLVLVVRALSLETGLLVHVELARLQHVFGVVLEFEVLENLGVHSVQTIHTGKPTAGECADLLDALLEVLRVARVVGGYAENLLPVCVDQMTGNQCPEGLVGPGHMASDKLELFEIEEHWPAEFGPQRAPKVSQLGRKRDGHIGGIESLILFFVVSDEFLFYQTLEPVVIGLARLSMETYNATARVKQPSHVHDSPFTYAIIG